MTVTFCVVNKIPKPRERGFACYKRTTEYAA